jgi:hypothetical protein
MFVLMAADARAGESEIGVIQVLYLNSCSPRGQDFTGIVTLLTTQSGVAACQRESGLPMIHGLTAWLPANEGKVRAIVIGMALYAILARSLRSDPHRVHAAILCETVADFRVAIQAFELHAARSHVVTFRAAQDSGKRLMRFRQRTGRDLRMRRGSTEDEC